MKKIVFFFILVFCLIAVVAQSSNYGKKELLQYMTKAPNSFLPEENQEINITPGFFSVVSANIDGDSVDYLVYIFGQKEHRPYMRPIYIYGENIKTRTTSFYDIGGVLVQDIIIGNEITIMFTGKTAPAISVTGNRIEVPIFIQK